MTNELVRSVRTYLFAGDPGVIEFRLLNLKRERDGDRDLTVQVTLRGTGGGSVPVLTDAVLKEMETPFRVVLPTPIQYGGRYIFHVEYSSGTHSRHIFARSAGEDGFPEDKAAW